MGAAYWVNYLAEKTVSAEVSTILDSGVYLFDYINPFLQIPITAYGNAAVLLLATEGIGLGVS